MTTDADVPSSAPTALPGSTMRPSRAAYLRAIRANLWVAIPLLLISLVRIGLNPWLLPVFVVAIGLTLGGVLLYFRRVRVEFGDGRYLVTRMLGAAISFTAAQVGALVTVVSLNSGSTAPAAPQLILTRPDGSKLLRLRGQTWEVEQFAALADDLLARGVVNDAIVEPITTAQLRARYPKVIGWWEAHPIAFGLILGIVVLAIVVVIAVFAVSLAG
ncbi:MAG: hypothetical protein M3O28_02965 [Actinomycetota bacterium]|nr:hypothetical protein [Actinomycetota bacterium]